MWLELVEAQQMRGGLINIEVNSPWKQGECKRSKWFKNLLGIDMGDWGAINQPKLQGVDLVLQELNKINLIYNNDDLWA